jgi:dipeptidyl aminopeptidase/acylaminoacyl peptidase
LAQHDRHHSGRTRASGSRISSLMAAGKVTTPTLLMTGVLDRRTPMPQTEEYYAALKVRGVPVKLLQFEGEYHGTGSKPANFIRTELYTMSWFKRYSRMHEGQSTSAVGLNQ